MPLPEWNSLIAGKDCPFCLKTDQDDAYHVKVADLEVATLWLNRNQVYPGYGLLIFRKRHVTGLEYLTADEHALFMADLKRAGDAIFKTATPDLMNYASLGNVIPHLHVHIIPRYKNDPRWGAPVWMTHHSEMSEAFLSEEEYSVLTRKIRDNL